MSNHIHVARRRLLTVRQTARKLNVCESTLTQWCERGLIKPYDPESSIPSRFYESDVSALQVRLLEVRDSNDNRLIEVESAE